MYYGYVMSTMNGEEGEYARDEHLFDALTHMYNLGRIMENCTLYLEKPGFGQVFVMEFYYGYIERATLGTGVSVFNLVDDKTDVERAILAQKSLGRTLEWVLAMEKIR